MDFFFAALAFRDVFGDAGDAIDLARLVANRKAAGPDPALRAIGAGNAIFEFEATRFFRILEHQQNAVPIVDVNRVRPRFRIRVQARAALAPDLLVRRAHIKHLRAGRVDQKEDFANVFRQLPETGLAVSQFVGRAPALVALDMQPLELTTDLPKQGAVLVDATHLSGERDQQALIVVAEGLAAQLVGEADPAVNFLDRCNRRDQARMHRRKSRRQPDISRVAVQHREATRPSLALHDAERPIVDPHRRQLRCDGGLQSADRAKNGIGVVFLTHRERRVFDADQLARAAANALQQGPRVALGRKLHVQIDQRREPQVADLQILGRRVQFVGYQLQVFAIKAVADTSVIAAWIAP